MGYAGYERAAIGLEHGVSQVPARPFSRALRGLSLVLHSSLVLH
jgi:hypothetical protein